MLQVAGGASAPAGRASFTAAEARQQLECSLRELKTERIDLWLLHEAAAEDLRDEDLLRLLEDQVQVGTIGAFGVGSERAKVEALLRQRPEYCGTVQFEWSVMDRAAPPMRSFRIQHRALTDNFRALHARIAGDKARAAQWSANAGADLADRGVLARLMLKAALLENPAGIVLFSSKDPAHMRGNVETADDAGLEAAARRLYALVQGEMAETARPRVAVAG
jgi:diketogulonate reductase-like aldo/keto reductase